MVVQFRKYKGLSQSAPLAMYPVSKGCEGWWPWGDRHSVFSDTRDSEPEATGTLPSQTRGTVNLRWQEHCLLTPFPSSTWLPCEARCSLCRAYQVLVWQVAQLFLANCFNLASIFCLYRFYYIFMTSRFLGFICPGLENWPKVHIQNFYRL